MTTITNNQSDPAAGELLPALQLTGLAADINREHGLATAAAWTAVEHARRCGQLLIEAKSQIGHGGFLAWLADNCEVGERQARRYMKIAQHWPAIEAKSDPTSDLTIKGALRLMDDRQANPAAETIPPPKTLRQIRNELAMQVLWEERAIGCVLNWGQSHGKQDAPFPAWLYDLTPDELSDFCETIIESGAYNHIEAMEQRWAEHYRIYITPFPQMFHIALLAEHGKQEAADALCRELCDSLKAAGVDPHEPPKLPSFEEAMDWFQSLGIEA